MAKHKLLTFALVGALCTVFLGLLTPYLTGFDQTLLSWLEVLRSPPLNQLALDATAWGSGATFIAVCGSSLLLCGLQKKSAKAGFWLLMMAGGLTLTPLLKHGIARDRPLIMEHLVAVQGYSYPSGHATHSALLAFAMFWSWQHTLPPAARRGLAVVCLGFALLTGFSRLYLGVHYLSDVLGGWLFGVSWGLLAAWICRENDRVS